MSTSDLNQRVPRLRCCKPTCDNALSGMSAEGTPYTLFPCGCNVCGVCFVAFGKAFPGTKCPGCDNIVESSMKNDLLRRVCESMAVFGCSDTTRSLCGECDEDLPEAAVHSCSTCNVLLCEFHREAHQRTRGTSSHRIVPLCEATASSESEPAPRSPIERCRHHPTESAEYYCPKCKEVLCTRCNSQPHLEACGRVLSVSEALPVLRRQLFRECSRLSDIKQRLFQSISRAEAIEGQFAASMKGKQAVLCRGFDALADCVARAKITASQQLDGEANRAMHSLSQRSASLLQRFAQLTPAIAECSILAASGGCTAVSSALKWSEQYVLHEAEESLESLHVDAAVVVDMLSPLIEKCWAVVSSHSSVARDLVRICFDTLIFIVSLKGHSVVS